MARGTGSATVGPMLRSVAAFLAAASLATAVEIRVATFNLGVRFTANSEGVFVPDYSVGDPGSPDHESVRAILARIDADVVALQEITTNDVSGSPSDLGALAASLGYPHVFIAPTSGGGSLVSPFDFTLRNVWLSRHPFISTSVIRSPAGARELTRLHAVVKVDVPGTTRDPVLINAHLKPEGGSNRFRRAVEMQRLVAELNTQGLTEEDNFILLGDFNLNPNYGNASYAAVPTDSEIPPSYDLGDDIVLPVDYFVDPLAYFSTPSVFRLDPRQPDGSAATLDSGYAIDLILVSPALAGRPVHTEIYNSALDTPAFPGLPKAGDPPDTGTSSVASDHYAVFADLNLDPAGPYVFTAPGQTVMEDFSGFLGTRDPAPWVTAGGLPWRGRNDGSSGTPGFHAHGSEADPSFGLIPEGTASTASATFTNQSGVPLTALQIAFDVEQWRAALNGTADTLGAALLVDGQTIPLPDLSHAASQSLPSGAVPDGVTTSKSTTVTGLQIAPGASFELRITFTPGPGGGAQPTAVFLNEFHYENAGDDAGEFLEVVVGQGFPRPLSDLEVVLYNGNAGSAAVVYDTLNLADDFTRAGSSNGFDLHVIDLPEGGLQNGARDGFAVVDKGTSQVLQLVSYEGTFTASNGPAAGMTSVAVGPVQSTSTPLGSSIGLTGSGGGHPAFTWAASIGTNTKGSPNSGQTFANPFLQSQGLAVDNLSVTAFADADFDGDGIVDSLDPDDDNDGQSDADEIAFGTDPLNAASVFKPVLARAVIPADGYTLTFPGAGGITYTVETSADLGDWAEFSTQVGSGQQIVVELPLAGPARFYRVRAGE